MIVQKIFAIIAETNKDRGVTMLLVEQNAVIALETATRGYVLETGRITMEGETRELRNNPQIRKAYLGED